MLFRNLRPEDTQHPNPPQEAPGGGNLDEVREAGQSLFAAADEAIRRALSGNSQAFLEATRQEGGQ